MPSSLLVVCPACHTVNRVPATRLDDAGRCGKCHGPLFPGEPIELNEQEFDTHVNRSDLPVVVDFWAPWCAPCRMMAPAFAEAARELAPHYRFIKINTESIPNLGARFAIRSIPTLAMFSGGREVARQAGALNARQIIQWVQLNDADGKR